MTMSNVQTKLLQALESDSLIVCASRRQVRTIVNLQDKQQSELNKNSWNRASVLSWQDWLLSLFEMCAVANTFFLERDISETDSQPDDESNNYFVPTLLFLSEEKWIWKKLFNEQKEQADKWSVAQKKSLLNSLHSAWKLFNQWQLDFNESSLNKISFEQTEEPKLFKQLVQDFENYCYNNQYISQYKLSDYLIEHVFEKNKQINVLLQLQSPSLGDICLYGFDDLTPQQQKLIKKFEELGKKVINIEFLDSVYSPVQSDSSLIACASKETEWYAAAKWSRQLAEENPEANIAIVVPDLANEQSRIFQIFQTNFQPEQTFKPTSEVSQGFNISVGETLVQQDVVISARRWLRLAKGADLDSWLQAIVDPFCAGAKTEIWSRASLRQQLSVQKQNNLQLSPWLHQKQLSRINIEPLQKWKQLVVMLEQAFSEPVKIERNNLPSFWCVWSENLLVKIGWPGEQALGSVCYQAQQQWLSQLRLLAKMDKLVGKISHAEFMELIDDQLSSVIFQPESPTARVQVLGLFEAIGLPFDYLRLTGMDANTLPASAKPNPWLPVSLQKSLNMPGASSQRELAFSQKLISGFDALCSQCSYSYAVADLNTDNLPSPLVSHLPPAETISAEASNEWVNLQTSAQHHLQQDWQDEYGMALTTQTQTRSKELSYSVKGGVSLLKDQAACPFRAYARHRLFAKMPDVEDIGIDPMVRGNWVHQTLEKFWQKIGHHQILLDMTKPQILQQVQDCAKLVILKDNEENVLVRFEYNRTVDLVMVWLELDLQRLPFERVLVEQEKELKVAGLKFNVRVDRIDELDNEQYLIIDYKTGTPNTSGWNQPRLDEPQLPLYAMLLQQKTGAIAFGQLNIKACLLKGYGDKHINISGIKVGEKLPKSWAELMDFWKHNLTLIAQEYIEGLASVTPTIRACDYCDLSHLCRVNAIRVVNQAEEQTDDKLNIEKPFENKVEKS